MILYRRYLFEYIVPIAPYCFIAIAEVFSYSIYIRVRVIGEGLSNGFAGAWEKLRCYFLAIILVIALRLY
jgi:hypothetical protein